MARRICIHYTSFGRDSSFKISRIIYAGPRSLIGLLLLADRILPAAPYKIRACAEEAEGHPVFYALDVHLDHPCIIERSLPSVSVPFPSFILTIAEKNGSACSRMIQYREESS